MNTYTIGVSVLFSIISITLIYYSSNVHFTFDYPKYNPNMVFYVIHCAKSCWGPLGSTRLAHQLRAESCCFGLLLIDEVPAPGSCRRETIGIAGIYIGYILGLYWDKGKQNVATTQDVQKGACLRATSGYTVFE